MKAKFNKETVQPELYALKHLNSSYLITPLPSQVVPVGNKENPFKCSLCIRHSVTLGVYRGIFLALFLYNSFVV